MRCLIRSLWRRTLPARLRARRRILAWRLRMVQRDLDLLEATLDNGHKEADMLALKQHRLITQLLAEPPAP